MILIGQYDSPFVRRVGIALTIYEIPFDHRPWSTFGDAEKIRPYNPLTRVPTVVLDNGDVLIESQSIIDYLDRLGLDQVTCQRTRCMGQQPAQAQSQRSHLLQSLPLSVAIPCRAVLQQDQAM